MCRYYHFLACTYDLLLLKCTWWHLSDFTTSNRALVRLRWCGQGWILLWSFPGYERNIFQLNPLHYGGTVSLPHCHATSWGHRMMWRCWVCLDRVCRLGRVRGQGWGSELDHFLWQNLSLVLVSLWRLIVAGNFCLWSVADGLASNSWLEPCSSEHRTWRLLLRVFRCVLWCHHVVQVSLSLLLNYTICF